MDCSEDVRKCGECGKWHHKKAKICNSCHTRKWRKDHPVEAAYMNLRNNAKRRNVYFDISFEDFKDFLYQTDYMEKKGWYGDDLTIDRVRRIGGYTKGNLSILSRRDNASKYNKVDKFDKLEVKCPF